MPLSVLMEILMEFLGSVLLEPVIQRIGEESAKTAKDVGTTVIDKAEAAKERARARALAMADVIVLAAHHDGVITDAERAELERRIPKLLDRAGVALGVEEFVDHWAALRAPLESESALREEVARRCGALTSSDRQRLFDVVVRIACADNPAQPRDLGPYRRGARTPPAATIRLFGQALSVEASAIEEAAARSRSSRNA